MFPSIADVAVLSVDVNIGKVHVDVRCTAAGASGPGWSASIWAVRRFPNARGGGRSLRVHSARHPFGNDGEVPRDDPPQHVPPPLDLKSAFRAVAVGATGTLGTGTMICGLCPTAGVGRWCHRGAPNRWRGTGRRGSRPRNAASFWRPGRPAAWSSAAGRPSPAVRHGFPCRPRRSRRRDRVHHRSGPGPRRRCFRRRYPGQGCGRRRRRPVGGVRGQGRPWFRRQRGAE